LTRFAHAIREELWSRGRLLESRLEHGEALGDETGILARDARDDALVAACDRELERLRAAMPEDALVRLVAEASLEEISSAMTVRVGPLSIVTDAVHVERDMDLLRRSRTLRSDAGLQAPDPSVPLLWLHGSAAVLLHEAAGHAQEHGHDPLTLPAWLRIDIPLRLRRATFRDVPLLRMSRVLVSQNGAPFDVPSDPVEVHLVEGGAYEPLTGMVTVRVAAAEHRGLPVAPFEIHVHRNAIRFLGASGDPIRYPGVICSREGQELVVGSWAPLLLTELT